MSKIDITSTTIEKGIDLVKDFVEKFLGSTIEEAGLFMADNIKLRRFKNQIKILEKAQKIVAETNIDIKQISLKNLVPLLEYSSLEEDETLQTKWANLLVNYIDSKNKYESSVFPYILSQMTSNEVSEMDDLYKIKINRPHFITINGIEISNLVRLGLIELITDINSRINVLSELNVNSYDYMLHSANGLKTYMITDLGNSFVECCSTK